MFLSAAWSLFSFYLIFGGVVPLDAASQAYFASIGILDWLITGAILALNLAGAVALFMLRKLAVNLFIGAFAFNILSVVMAILQTSWAKVMGSDGLIGVAFGWALAIAIILYARNLAQKGVLH